MDNESLIALLNRRARGRGLAPFYIVQSHPHLPAEALQRWMVQLLSNSTRESPGKAPTP